jgi:hypothetical protein
MVHPSQFPLPPHYQNFSSQLRQRTAGVQRLVIQGFKVVPISYIWASLLFRKCSIIVYQLPIISNKIMIADYYMLPLFVLLFPIVAKKTPVCQLFLVPFAPIHTVHLQNYRTNVSNKLLFAKFQLPPSSVFRYHPNFNLPR